jgi:hypothetical protein
MFNKNRENLCIYENIDINLTDAALPDASLNVHSRCKILPMDTQELFRAISECECSTCPNGLLTDIIHPCLLYLQPAAANSHLRPPRPWTTSCSTPPLRSLFQLSEVPQLRPLSLPVAREVPGSPVHDTFCATAAAASLYHWLRLVPSGTRAATTAVPPPLCFSPRNVRECRRHRSCRRHHTITTAANHCRRPHHYAGTHAFHYHHRPRLPLPH